MSETRRITVRLPVELIVELEFNEEGQGDIVDIKSSPCQSWSKREVEEALDGDGQLGDLDRHE